jgi:HPt (histidine-containing phosphotransfer) domain-containing protein
MTLDRRLIDQMVADVGPEAFQRLAGLFQEETREAAKEIGRLAGAPSSGIDWRELGRRAHSLKHAAESFGLIELAAIAFQIEHAADAKDAPRVAQGVSALDIIASAGLAELSALQGDPAFPALK